MILKAHFVISDRSVDKGYTASYKWSVMTVSIMYCLAFVIAVDFRYNSSNNSLRMMSHSLPKTF